MNITRVLQYSVSLYDQLEAETGFAFGKSRAMAVFDAELGFCVALDKDNFIGREAIAKVKAGEPKWNLCSFTIFCRLQGFRFRPSPILIY
jgi:glycine cleavage system aminomethyltransferase T